LLPHQTKLLVNKSNSKKNTGLLFLKKCYYQQCRLALKATVYFQSSTSMRSSKAGAFQIVAVPGGL